MPEAKPTSRRVFRVGLYVCAAAVAALAFTPLNEPALASNDKLNHILAFAVLAWLADGAYPGETRAGTRLGLLLAFGFLIEVVQHCLPYRYFSWLDLAADALGVLGYMATAHVLARAKRSARAH